MGKKCGLDFNTNPPSAIVTNISSFEANASVCGPNGHLLFYTNGTDVWDSTGTLMPNGQTINGILDHTVSSTQGALIVPDPGNEQAYYLFSLATELYVNRIDMSLDNGMGDVDLSYSLHGLPLEDSLCEKMIAIRGCNDNVWVLVKSKKTQPSFLAFEVTASGVNVNPISSATGHFSGPSYFQGQMKASPDGKKIVTLNTPSSGIELYNFDFVTGKAAAGKILDSVSGYGCAFSPLSSKLYVISNAGELMQYDLNVSNPALTKTILSSQLPPSHLKLGVDDKIYFLSSQGAFLSQGNSYLARINSPETAGPGCMVQDSVTSLAYPNSSTSGLTLGLPNEVVIAANTEQALENRVVLDTGICTESGFPGTTLDATSDFNTYSWDDQSTGTTRYVSQAGIYWVTYQTVCGRRTDTFKINLEIMPLSILLDNLVLSANNHYDTYQWYLDGQLLPGATDSMFSIQDTGMYSLKVTMLSGCADSAIYHVTDVTGIDEAGHIDKGMIVYPNPVRSVLNVGIKTRSELQLSDMTGRLLKRTTGKQLYVNDLEEGLYLLKVYDAQSGRLIDTRKLVKVKN